MFFFNLAMDQSHNFLKLNFLSIIWGTLSHTLLVSLQNKMTYKLLNIKLEIPTQKPVEQKQI